MMPHYSVMAELARQRQADLHRAADASRLTAAARVDPDAVDTQPHRSAARRVRRRLGVLLVVWGSRLAPVDPPAC